MKIIFVTGPSFSGKSIYIRNELPDTKVININVFNKVAEAAYNNEELEELGLNAYYYCREALQNTIRAAEEDDTIVLECQLLGKEDRSFFVKAVREVTDAPIELVLMWPEEEKIYKLLDGEQTLVNLHLFEKSMLEMPHIEEGFAAISIIHPEFEDTDWNTMVRKSS